jgi:hypothetical protein
MTFYDDIHLHDKNASGCFVHGARGIFVEAPIPFKKRVNPQRHHAGWMMCGQKALFYCIPDT